MLTRTRPRHPALVACLIVALLVAPATGCGLPDGDRLTPEGAHYHLLHIRQSGDTAEMWDVLHPDIQALITTWHTAEKDTLFAIENIYPDEHKAAALEALEGGDRGRLPSPRALFEYLLDDTGGESLGTMALIGARASSVALDGDRAIINTWAGDRVHLRQGPGEVWFATLSPTEEASMKEAIAAAQGNRDRATRNKQLFRGELPAGVQ